MNVIGSQQEIRDNRIPRSEVMRLKDLGFVQNKGTNSFNCRIVTNSGMITAPQMEALTEASKTYGNGQVIISSVGIVEIAGIPYEKVCDIIDFCQENELSIGGGGPHIRPLTACQGACCEYGVLDSFALSEKIREMFYVRLKDMVLPGKFEIAVSGCPEDCMNVILNDVGIVGVRIPNFEPAKCQNCKNCSVVRSCPTGAATFHEGKITILQKRCDKCGICVGKCPNEVVKNSTMAYRIYVGGQKGRNMIKGKQFRRLFTSEELLLSVLVRIIYLYQEHGSHNEAFCDFVKRLGVTNIENAVMGK